MSTGDVLSHDESHTLQQFATVSDPGNPSDSIAGNTNLNIDSLNICRALFIYSSEFNVELYKSFNFMVILKHI